MIDSFAELLKDFGSVAQASLHPDKHGACKVMVNQKFAIQIEHDPFKDRLLLVSFIADLPPGKFRENVLREALKANGVFPKTGILGYAGRKDQLTLSDFYPLKEFRAQKFSEYLTAFAEKVDFWKTELNKGNVPVVVVTRLEPHPSPFFKKS